MNKIKKDENGFSICPYKGQLRAGICSNCEYKNKKDCIKTIWEDEQINLMYNTDENFRNFLNKNN